MPKFEQSVLCIPNCMLAFSAYHMLWILVDSSGSPCSTYARRDPQFPYATYNAFLITLCRIHVLQVMPQK